MLFYQGPQRGAVGAVQFMEGLPPQGPRHGAVGAAQFMEGQGGATSPGPSSLSSGS